MKKLGSHKDSFVATIKTTLKMYQQQQTNQWVLSQKQLDLLFSLLLLTMENSQKIPKIKYRKISKIGQARWLFQFSFVSYIY